MSTRFPARISPSGGIRLSATGRKFFFKSWIVDAVFVGMVVASIVGIVYRWLR